MKNNLISENEVKLLVQQTNLKHIAIIMDGNRRWAKSKFLPSAAGHTKGVESLRTILKSFVKYGIKYLTVYAFSTENWKRTKEEVDFLMSLLAKTMVNELPLFQENNIKLKFIGDKDSLDEKLKNILLDAENETSNNTGVNLQIAFNYGSRSEITNACKKLCKQVLDNKILIEDISEENISSELYTTEIPDPDLLIRTGGEKRISNYLLWQCAYSEIYVTDTFWPDFDEQSLIEAILEFNSRNRRYGK